ncbi:MAG: phosphatase PAP2 family protein [Acidimicrobiia bacterium]|nr:phosphatase PAP2 family protein [Acidimicrobiia bacterium]
MNAPPSSPPPSPLEHAVGRLDDAVDRAFDRYLRGRPLVDRAMYSITEVADFSVLWHLVSAARAAQGERNHASSLRLSLGLMAQGTLVDGLLKSLVKRERPVPEFERPHNLRIPLTTSFPSGHASAAFCAAGLLSEGSRFGPAWYGLATVVAASRVHVKIHHASDVLVGAAVGATVAQVVKRVWPLRRR